MKKVVVLGSGFAGLWAAVGAARRLDELHISARDVGVTVISSQPFHDIRVRNYESDLSACRIPLSAVLDPVGVAHVTADVTAIDEEVPAADARVHGVMSLPASMISVSMTIASTKIAMMPAMI